MNIKKILLTLLVAFFASTSVGYATEQQDTTAATEQTEHTYHSKSMTELMASFWKTTGINAILDTNDGEMTSEPNGSYNFV